jgi:hypothetical protein
MLREQWPKGPLGAGGSIRLTAAFSYEGSGLHPDCWLLGFPGSGNLLQGLQARPITQANFGELPGLPYGRVPWPPLPPSLLLPFYTAALAHPSIPCTHVSRTCAPGRVLSGKLTLGQLRRGSGAAPAEHALRWGAGRCLNYTVSCSC